MQFPSAPFPFLAHVISLLSGEHAIPVDQLSAPRHETVLEYLCAIIDDDALQSACPGIPLERSAELRRIASTQLAVIQRAQHRTRVPPSPGAGPPPFSPDRASKNPLDRRWAFNGTTCASIGSERVSVQLWLETIIAEFKGNRILDGQLQGQYMRQLVDSPLRDQLACKIEELTEVKAAVEAGEATLEGPTRVTMPPRSSPAPTRAMLWPVITRPAVPRGVAARSSQTRCPAPSWPSAPPPPTVASRAKPAASLHSSAS